MSSGLSIAPSYIILAGSGGGGHRRGLESASCPCMEGVVEQPAKRQIDAIITMPIFISFNFLVAYINIL
jgi:hypothetical protein